MKQLLWVFAVIVALWEASELLERFASGGEPEDLVAWRDAAASVREESVAVLVENDRSLSPVDRRRLIAANWELGPRPAAVIASAYIRKESAAALQDAGYAPVKQCGETTVWSHSSAEPLPEAARSPDRSLRADLAATVVIVGFVLMVLALARVRPTLGPKSGLGLMVFVLLSTVTLSHGLTTPNGLGVYVGKAKLFLEAGGIPTGFFTASGYAPYQPAYPPGLTLLALLVGLGGEVAASGIIQLLPSAAIALLFILGVAETKSRLTVLVALLLACSPLTVRLAESFAAEPFVVLALVIGLRRVRIGAIKSGWFIVGCAGWFRPEGLLLAAVYSELRLPALLPGLCWQATVLALRSGLQEYAFGAGPSVRNLALALKALLGCTVTSPFVNGGLFAWLCASRLRRDGVRLVQLAVVLAAGLALLACTVSGYAEWMIGECVPRFVWEATLPLLLLHDNITTTSRFMTQNRLVTNPTHLYN